MKFAECKNHKESIGLLFWQSSMLWQRKIKQILQSYNLTHTQFVILAVIEELTEQDVCITQKKISDFSMIDVMTVSSTVRLLEKKGLIYRLPHKTDTRANSISNTEEGKSCLKQAVIDVESVDKTFFFNNSSRVIILPYSSLYFTILSILVLVKPDIYLSIDGLAVFTFTPTKLTLFSTTKSSDSLSFFWLTSC